MKNYPFDYKIDKTIWTITCLQWNSSKKSEKNLMFSCNISIYKWEKNLFVHTAQKIFQTSKL